MKADRVLNIVLSLGVVCLGYVLLTGRGKPAEEPPKERWRTNTVELWRTNTVKVWTTNTVEVWRTNTVLRPVTNEVIKEVIKEVPAKLSAMQKEAAIAGYRYLKAPALPNRADILYKATPLAVEVRVEESARSLLTGDTEPIKRSVEQTLRSRSIPVAEQSPYQLSLSLTAPWTTDVPSVALFALRLELRERVTLRRQDAILGSPGSVWTSAALGTVGKDRAAEEVKGAVQKLLGQFCTEYLEARGREKETESHLPSPPGDLVSGAQ